jgi:hypothetical protein
MPRYDRSQIKKGMYMQGAPHAAQFVARRGRDDDEAVRRRYPEFENVIKEAGPSYGPAFEKHQAEVAQLAQRLQMVRRQLDSYRGKGSKK